MVSGSPPSSASTLSMWVMSSKLMIPPSRAAKANSPGGVSFEENIISSPEKPQASLIMSSVSEEQSTPQPYSLRIFNKKGFGVALTAKYSRKPLFQAKASRTRAAFSRMPLSS